MAEDRFSLLLYRTSVLGCGLGGIATLYFLGGVLGQIASPVLNITAAVSVVLAALFFLYVFLVSLRDRSRLGFFLWLLILSVLGVELVLGLVPPTARDELSHHLAIPRLYVNAGRVFEISFAPYSYYPMLLDMLYTPWVRWGWDSIPKLIHGLFGFLTALLLYAYLARRLSPIYGLLGFLSYVSTPAILRLSNWAYVDLGVVFYATASLLCLLRWLEAVEERRWLVCAGIAAGFAIATKPNGLLTLLLLFFLMVFGIGRLQQRKRMRATGQMLLFLLLALVCVSPWLVKNLIWTGNPFYPLLGGWFGSGGGGGVSIGGTSAGGTPELGIFGRRNLLYGESEWEIALLPLRVFFFGQDDRPQFFDGVLNPILILFLPWVFRGKWLEEKRLIFGFALFYFLYALFLTDLRIRYILPIVPPLVILLVYGIHNVYLRIVRPSFLFGAVILLFTLNGIYLWSYSHKVTPLEYIRGGESRDGYLSRMLPEYPAIQYINQNLPRTATIYVLFVGRRVYYCERDYFHDSGDLPELFLQMIQNARDENDVRMKLREKGITHLLVREELLGRYLSNNLTPEQLSIGTSFASRHLQGLFHDRGYSVYLIHG